jgi:hypothetical protein
MYIQKLRWRYIRSSTLFTNPQKYKFDRVRSYNFFKAVLLNLQYFYVVFCRSLLARKSFFFLSLHCMVLFDLQLIIPLYFHTFFICSVSYRSFCIYIQIICFAMLLLLLFYSKKTKTKQTNKISHRNPEISQ